MGQIVSDVKDILEYNKDKKAAKNQRQEILQKMQAVQNILTQQRLRF